jgi:hypothetical protein
MVRPPSGSINSRATISGGALRDHRLRLFDRFAVGIRVQTNEASEADGIT